LLIASGRIAYGVWDVETRKRAGFVQREIVLVWNHNKKLLCGPARNGKL
jgi:hypothetical protein